MTDNNHPITPPLELVQQWLNAPRYAKSPKDGTFVVQKCHSLSESEVIALVENAARWGADQELDACCEWLQVWFWQHEDLPKKLRATRRPKPPSLKAQALDRCNDYIDPEGIIRRALESLPN